MLKLYNYLYFQLYSSIQKSGGVDPSFSAVAMISFYEIEIGFILIALYEIIFKEKINIEEPLAISVVITLLLINSVYFFFRKRYQLIISNEKFINRGNKLQTWHFIALMFLFMLIFASLMMISSQIAGD